MEEVLQLNEPEDFEFDAVNVYRSLTGQTVTFTVTPDQWEIVDYGDVSGNVHPERDFGKWPIATGPIASSPEPGCLIIDNLDLKQRLIIDALDALRPKRSIIPMSMSGRCGCPLVDECLSLRAE